MTRPRQLTLAKDAILGFFDGSLRKVFAYTELSRVLADHRTNWHLAQRTNTEDLIEFLETQGKLKRRTFYSSAYNREITRYSWGEANKYELAQSIQQRGYLSHSTALALHGLTEPARCFFLDVEQTPKPTAAASLTQAGIDKAFSRPQRQSNLTYEHDNWSVTIINGKHTNGLGVEQLHMQGGERLQVTNPERTLVDIVVRPAYAGGITQVLSAYKAAKERISIDKLSATLKELDYAYPYHQAIGFLLEAAGYAEQHFEPLRQMGLNYDFYLAHSMEQPEYSKTWRLFHPKDL